MVLTKKQSSLRYPKIKIGFHPLKNVRYPKIWLVSSFNRKIHHFPMVGTRLDGFHRLFRLSGDGACSYQSSLGFGWSLAEVRDDGMIWNKFATEKKWDGHDGFFLPPVQICMDMNMDMIWYDKLWQICHQVPDVPEFAFFLDPDFGMVVKSIL